MALEVEAVATPVPTRRWSRPEWPPLYLIAPSALVGAALLLPIAYVLVRTLGAGADAWDLLVRTSVLETLLRTIYLAAGVTAATMAIALPVAWLTVRTDLPFRRVWAVLTVLPLVIPSYVGGLVAVAALGPKGLVQQMLEGPFGVDRMPDIYGLPGATLVLALLSYPYVLLSIRAALWTLDPALEEASRGLGNGAWATFRRVTLPHLRPAIAAGGLLVALYTLSDFGAVSLLRFNSFTRVIFLQYETAFDRTLAAASSLVLVMVALVLLVIEARARGRSLYHRTSAGAARRTATLQLGRWRWPALAFMGTVVAFALAAPMAVLGYWLVRGVQAGEPLGFVWDAAASSLYVSALAAAATLVAALPVAMLTVRHPGWASAILERITYIGFALPGIVVALAFVYFGARYVTPIYQTLGLLVLAYVLLFLPVAVGTLRASLLQINPHVEEAARSLGRPPLHVFVTVVLPMLRAAMLASAIGVFLVTMKELPATLILSPLEFKTLATVTWSASSAAFFARAAAPALLLVLLSSIPVAFFTFREQRWG